MTASTQGRLCLTDCGIALGQQETWRRGAHKRENKSNYKFIH